MPNRLTQVPERPVPALPAAGRLVIPIADAFMLLMLSRPASGSLRTTWVTPATLWLCALVVAAGVPLASVALASHSGTLRVVAAAVIILLSLGSAAVLAVGAMQRRCS